MYYLYQLNVITMKSRELILGVYTVCGFSCTQIPSPSSSQNAVMFLLGTCV